MNTEAESHLRGTAYHEAAHAVVAWRLGLDVHSIVLREQGADCETNTESPTALPLTDQLAIYLAGQKPRCCSIVHFRKMRVLMIAGRLRSCFWDFRPAKIASNAILRTNARMNC